MTSFTPLDFIVGVLATSITNPIKTAVYEQAERANLRNSTCLLIPFMQLMITSAKTFRGKALPFSISVLIIN